MIKIFILIALTAISSLLMAQNKITVANVDFATADPAHKVANQSITLEAENVKKFSGETKDKLTIKIENIPVGATIKTTTGESVTTEGADNYFDITTAIKAAIAAEEEDKMYKITFKPAGAAAGLAATLSTTIILKWKKIPKEDVNAASFIQGKKNRDKIINGFKANAAFSNPYDNKNNRIDLYFNENGKLLSHLPVNVDQNDIFYMHIVCEKGDEDKYSVNITEGEFAPTDLAIRPFTKLTDASASSTGIAAEQAPKVYTSIVLQAGPFTTDNFKFQISYDSSGIEKNGLLYSLKVNKLFHVGIGVSIVSSGLEAPDYKTLITGTDTTLQALNGGRRTLFTFNVIWYWSIFHQKSKGSVIPNGRDVLKDEPSFSLTRLYPTVGVSLDSKFKENFFLGAVYEFARGGSFTAGLHYGKVAELVNKSSLNAPFSGTDAEIKLNNVYKPGFFIGLNVDTRILNLLFSKGQ